MAVTMARVTLTLTKDHTVVAGSISNTKDFHHLFWHKSAASQDRVKGKPELP